MVRTCSSQILLALSVAIIMALEWNIVFRDSRVAREQNLLEHIHSLQKSVVLLCPPNRGLLSKHLCRSPANDPSFFLPNRLNSVITSCSTSSNITIPFKTLETLEKVTPHRTPITSHLVKFCRTFIFFCLSFSFRAKHSWVTLWAICYASHHFHYLVQACFSSFWCSPVLMLFMHVLPLKRWCVQNRKSTRGPQNPLQRDPSDGTSVYIFQECNAYWTSKPKIS